MLKSAFLLVATVVLSLGAIGPVGAKTSHQVIVWNLTGKTIEHLYWRVPGDSWSDDELGEDDNGNTVTLDDAANQEIDIGKECVVEVKAVLEGKKTLPVQKADACSKGKDEVEFK